MSFSLASLPSVQTIAQNSSSRMISNGCCREQNSFGMIEQIDVAALQESFRPVDLVEKVEPHRRARHSTKRQNLGHKRRKGVVGDQHVELAVRPRGIEVGCRRNRPFDPNENVSNCVFQGLAARRQLHPTPDLHEEIVAEILAQAKERVAHRGLRHVHPSRCAAHAAQVEQVIEGDKEIQIELVEPHGSGRGRSLGQCSFIHEINSQYFNNQFFLCNIRCYWTWRGGRPMAFCKTSAGTRRTGAQSRSGIGG